MALTWDPLNRLFRSEQRFLILLCLIMGLLLLVPILQRFVAMRIFLDIFLTAIFISMVCTVGSKKGHVIAALVLAIMMVTLLWMSHFYSSKGIAAICMITGVLFIGVVITSILGFMFKSAVVNSEMIYAAILLYLLAALMWAFAYTFLELIDPASFNIDLERPEGYVLVFQYYSFVTITTLGYGDITPVTEVAKAFSVLEAVVGQLYLVVAVAWLVGMQVSQQSQRQSTHAAGPRPMARKVLGDR
jgi:hypothetical protein